MKNYKGLNDTELDICKGCVEVLVKHESDSRLKGMLLEVWARLRDEKTERVCSGSFNPGLPHENRVGAIEFNADGSITRKEKTEKKTKKQVVEKPVETVEKPEVQIKRPKTKFKRSRNT